MLTALSIAVNARFARELALIPPGVQVVVINGVGSPGREYRDFSATQELIAAGRGPRRRLC